jgi:hypothetical protein
LKAGVTAARLFASRPYKLAIFTMSPPNYTLELDHAQQRPPLAEPTSATIPRGLPEAKHHHTHAAFPVNGQVKHEDPTELSIYFVGTVRHWPCR